MIVTTSIALIRKRLEAGEPCTHEDRERTGTGTTWLCHCCGVHGGDRLLQETADRYQEHQQAMEALDALEKRLTKETREMTPVCDRFEYKLTRINGLTESMDEVNRQGGDGWELCGEEWGYFILKRKIVSEQMTREAFGVDLTPIENDLRMAQERIELLENENAVLSQIHTVLADAGVPPGHVLTRVKALAGMTSPVINLNRQVQVKLTEYGKGIFSGYCIQLKQRPLVEGYPTRFSLWEFAQIFGPVLYMGNPWIVVEDNSITLLPED